jgi:hypothetical protein
LIALLWDVGERFEGVLTGTTNPLLVAARPRTHAHAHTGHESVAASYAKPKKEATGNSEGPKCRSQTLEFLRVLEFAFIV